MTNHFRVNHDSCAEAYLKRSPNLVAANTVVRILASPIRPDQLKHICTRSVHAQYYLHLNTCSQLLTVHIHRCIWGCMTCILKLVQSAALRNFQHCVSHDGPSTQTHSVSHDGALEGTSWVAPPGALLLYIACNLASRAVLSWCPVIKRLINMEQHTSWKTPA